MSDERRERRLRMHLASGRIIDLDAPADAEPDDEDGWRPLGEIDSTTGRSTVDLEKARRWRPLAELRRW